ncbi:uncharacterized protein UV8b_05075 [Ustilaginoidea virens]|uniref:Uncharacterized protein n=1 Tax=Ustilaginoidea virens TaxID=1159556 RepID=A0A8E5HTC0_USTVR|nr:uncharacterized protein UV8b_05075 [Ustilaginoidea virens]QUC20834.1 hypothetical protein UV8b_05075 [Ustilaginoidea virens]
MASNNKRGEAPSMNRFMQQQRHVGKNDMAPPRTTSGLQGQQMTGEWQGNNNFNMPVTGSLPGQFMSPHTPTNSGMDSANVPRSGQFNPLLQQRFAFQESGQGFHQLDYTGTPLGALQEADRHLGNRNVASSALDVGLTMPMQPPPSGNLMGGMNRGPEFFDGSVGNRPGLSDYRASSYTGTQPLHAGAAQSQSYDSFPNQETMAPYYRIPGSHGISQHDGVTSATDFETNVQNMQMMGVSGSSANEPQPVVNQSINQTLGPVELSDRYYANPMVGKSGQSLKVAQPVGRGMGGAGGINPVKRTFRNQEWPTESHAVVQRKPAEPSRAPQTKAAPGSAATALGIVEAGIERAFVCGSLIAHARMFAHLKHELESNGTLAGRKIALSEDGTTDALVQGLRGRLVENHTKLRTESLGHEKLVQVHNWVKDQLLPKSQRQARAPTERGTGRPLYGGLSKPFSSNNDAKNTTAKTRPGRRTGKAAAKSGSSSMAASKGKEPMPTSTSQCTAFHHGGPEDDEAQAQSGTSRCMLTKHGEAEAQDLPHGTIVVNPVEAAGVDEAAPRVPKRKASSAGQAGGPASKRARKAGERQAQPPPSPAAQQGGGAEQGVRGARLLSLDDFFHDAESDDRGAMQTMPAQPAGGIDGRCDAGTEPFKPAALEGNQEDAASSEARQSAQEEARKIGRGRQEYEEEELTGAASRSVAYESLGQAVAGAAGDLAPSNDHGFFMHDMSAYDVASCLDASYGTSDRDEFDEMKWAVGYQGGGGGLGFDES